MKANKTTVGLMMFLYHSAGGNVSIILIACFVLGIVYLVTGLSAFHTFFVAMTIVAPPYCIITSIAGGYTSKYSSKWERFQLAMPVRRSDVTFSQYLCIVIASLVGVPFVVIVVGIGIAVHESLSVIAPQVLSATVSILSISIGIVLLLGALFFPLTCVKISKNRGESLAFVCLIVALGVIGFAAWVGYSMNIPQYIDAPLIITVSTILFIFSYFLTKKLYAKIDL